MRLPCVTLVLVGLALLPADTLVKEAEKGYALVSNGAPVRGTMVWTDPAGEKPRQTDIANDPTSVLVDGLDVKLIAPDKTEYYPYRLPPNPLHQALRDGRNDRDNVEVVDAPAVDGQWVIHVNQRVWLPARKSSPS